MLFALALLALSFIPGLLQAQYHISRTFPIGGDGSWDYVVPDPANHRVFIGRQNRVMTGR